MFVPRDNGCGEPKSPDFRILFQRIFAAPRPSVAVKSIARLCGRDTDTRALVPF